MVCEWASHAPKCVSRSKRSGSKCVNRDRVVKEQLLDGVVSRLPGCLDPMAVMSSVD